MNKYTAMWIFILSNLLLIMLILTLFYQNESVQVHQQINKLNVRINTKVLPCTTTINLMKPACIVYSTVVPTPGTIRMLCKKPTKQDLICKCQTVQRHHTSGRWPLKWIPHDWRRTEAKDIKLQTLWACPLLPVNNEEPDTSPVSSCPPLWPGLAQSGTQQALKDTQALHPI